MSDLFEYLRSLGMKDEDSKDLLPKTKEKKDFSDEIQNLLTTKYGIEEKDARPYAQQIMKNRGALDNHDQQIMNEALNNSVARNVSGPMRDVAMFPRISNMVDKYGTPAVAAHAPDLYFNYAKMIAASRLNTQRRAAEASKPEMRLETKHGNVTVNTPIPRRY